MIALLGAIQRRRRLNQMRARYNQQYRRDSDADIIIVQPVQPAQPVYGYNQFQGGYYQQPAYGRSNNGGQYGQPNYSQPYYYPPPSNNP